jgi:hypothetical protein
MEKLGDKMLSTQRVKISGDGAKMSRITNFVVLSFSLLSEGEKVMSTKGKYRHVNNIYLTFETWTHHLYIIFICICFNELLRYSHSCNSQW